MSTVYSIGVDLGTSRSSIATSRGKQAATRTCVGYPRDVIARKRFGREYLLGDEALANRLALDMVWPLADGVIRDDERAMEATGLILRHLVDHVLPDRKSGDKVHAAIGVPAQASINSKKAILDVTQDFIDKLLIVSEAFSVAYSIERFDECLIVDIGAGTTDICRMHGSMPEPDDQVTLSTAGNYLDEELTRAVHAKFPNVQLTPQIVRRIKEKYGYVSDTSDPIRVTLTEKGIPSEYDITDILHESCLKMTQPIATAIQELVGTFDPEFQRHLRENIVIAGGGSRLKGIDLAIEKSLEAYGGANAECVQDAEYCGCMGALKMSVEMPEEYWERL